MRHRIAATGSAVALLLSVPAFGQSVPNPPNPIVPTQGELDEDEDVEPVAPEAEPQYSPWQSNHASWFAATTTDLGLIYVRPRLNVGYGAPHWNFASLDAYVIVTNSFLSPYVGLRATLPFLDVFLGVRENFPYDRRTLEPKDTHDADDLSLADNGGDRSTYTAIDFEVQALAPVLHGVLFAQVHPVVLDAPRDRHIYEEVLRVVLNSRVAVGTRAGFLYGVGPKQTFKLGVVGEYVVQPNRPKNTIRAGPVAHLSINKNFEGLAAFSGIVDGPDSLRIVHGAYAYLGILHRSAWRF